MPSTAILWFRRDLRVHDHPALTAAVAEADVVVPVFVVDDALLNGRWPAPNRAWFMRESLVALSAALAERGAALRILRGRPADVLPALARETGASDLYLTRDAAPYGLGRDREVAARLAEDGVTVHAKRGLYVHEPDEVLTRDGRPFTVYGPFRRAWEARPRRAVLAAPDRIPGPPGARPDEIPDLGAPTADPALVPEPGEPAARARLAAWVDARVDAYAEQRNRMDLDGTSRLSQDLRWGLLSPAEVVDRAEGAGEGRRVFVSEVAWREFYAHVLCAPSARPARAVQARLRRPSVARRPGRLRGLAHGPDRLPGGGRGHAPAAGDRVHAQPGPHDRGLVPDQAPAAGLAPGRGGVHAPPGRRRRGLQQRRLAVDGRHRHRPAAVVPRLQPDPPGQALRPDGDYVRRWVPELRGIAGGAIHEPWMLDAAAQAAANVRIGTDYPAPIVDHAAARERARWRSTAPRVRRPGRLTPSRPARGSVASVRTLGRGAVPRSATLR